MIRLPEPVPNTSSQLDRRTQVIPLTASVIVAIAFGCSGSESPAVVGSGGGSTVGGAVTTGGQLATGGAIVRGGSRGLGGQQPSNGGASNQGGMAPAGGIASASGGRNDVGGSTPVASGGSLSTGGAPSAGGSTATGGTQSNGGVTTTGGTSPTGGSNTTGGALTTGGVHQTGGAPNLGGANASGGQVPIGAGGTGITNPGTINANACPGPIPSGYTADWCSCEQWGEWLNGSITFYNDIWGSGAGKQCIWANKSNQFGVAAAHPSGGSVKSYPNISYSPAKAISAINTYASAFEVAVPTTGVWETTYDLWVKSGSNPRIEIMLWINKAGGNQPIARSYGASGAVADQTNVNVGGHAWNVYTGSNGANHVVSLLRTANTNSGTLDIKAILDWIIANEKSFNSSWTLDQVQFGFEIISDSGTESFTTKSFSVTAS